MNFQRPAAGGGTAVESPIAQICDCGQHGVLLTFSAWGPGGPGAPSLPGNPGGPYINKGEGGNERGSGGGLPFLLPAVRASLLLMLSRNTTQEH